MIRYLVSLAFVLALLSCKEDKISPSALDVILSLKV